MVRKTLKREGNLLALPQVQVETLQRADLIAGGMFENMLAKGGLGKLRSRGIEILQVNVGRVCNQTCTHCHVDAGPDRRENMSQETAQQVVQLLQHPSIHTLDITGGAPEMNPQFRYLVEQGRLHDKHVIDRCNLTILESQGFTDLPEFLAAHQVEVVASLPCYLEENCDAQRGGGVFKKSIAALQRLNQLGYGKTDSGLVLSLVYNPVGLGLPPDQSSLEAAYREQLQSRYNITFNRLFTITNMPISRFLDDLLQHGNYLKYMQTLINAFNPATLDSVMCRSMLSIDWEGYIYDCDFNQMLGLPTGKQPSHISNLDWESLERREIQLGNHCFGCTAGHGSSCQGAVA